MIPRLEQLREDLGLTAKIFCEKANVDKSNYSKAVNGKGNLTDDMIQKFCKTYNIPEIYIRFGHSYMFNPDKDDMGETVQKLINQNSEVLKIFEGLGTEPKKHRDISPDAKGVPYYNVSFSMSFDMIGKDNTSTPDYMIDFEPYNTCDVWCNAHGDSMAPTIASGDLIALKRLWDMKYLINGDIYAIITKGGLRTIKRIKDNGDTLTLIPDNKAYDPQIIPKEEVEQIYIVKGSMKMF